LINIVQDNPLVGPYTKLYLSSPNST